MKTLVVLFVSVALLATFVCGYDTKHDNLDIEALAADKGWLTNLFDCFTDKKPCDDIGQDFKKLMPEVVGSACAKCSPTQKHKMRILLQGMNDKLPVEFGAFKKMVDPEGKLFPALNAALAKA